MTAPVSRVRPARRADVPAIHALIRELADFERLTHVCTGTADDLEQAAFGSRPVVEVLVAEELGKIDGFALFFHTFSTFLGRRGLWLEDLYVRPERRGSGIGTARLKALAALAVERGCGRFEWAVLDWNTPAIGFYERMGATVLPDWRIARVTGEALDRLGRDKS